MTTFPAKLDTLAKMITVVVITALIIPFITIGQHFGVNHDYKMIMIPVIVTVLMLFVSLFMPKSYLLNPSVLKIVQVGFSRTILLDNIDSIAAVNKVDLGMGIRTFGSGGFLGYLGKFWYKNAGHVTAYVTDRNKMLLITLKTGQKVIISPDDQQGFLQTLDQLKRA